MILPGCCCFPLRWSAAAAGAGALVPRMSLIMGLRNPKRAQRAVPVLSWLTPLGAVVSVINVTISLCTGEWLKSYERIPVDSPNVTHREEFIVKRTVSGLWTLCYSNNSKSSLLLFKSITLPYALCIIFELISIFSNSLKYPASNRKDSLP